MGAERLHSITKAGGSEKLHVLSPATVSLLVTGVQTKLG